MTQHRSSHRFTRRQALGMGAAGVLGAGLPSLASAQAANEVRILFAGGTWKDWYEQSFTNDFAAANNVKMNWRTGLRQAPLAIAQRRRPQWDLIHINQTESAQIGTMGILKPFVDAELPNLKDIHPSFKYEFLAGKIHTPYGLAVNTKRITRKIDSWLDMWDPAFKGKVAFPQFSWVGEEVFHAVNQVLGGSEDNVDPGIAKFKELFKSNGAILGNNVEHAIQLLSTEEIWIMPLFSARTDQARAKGGPVEFIVPKEGGLSWIWNTGLIANRGKASEEMAAKLVNMTLDPERQIAFSRRTGYPPTNVKAMKNLPADLKKLEISDADLEAYGKIQRKFDYMTMFAFKDQVTERFNKEVLA
ncbi:MAG: extracellular solute-binding protein [Alphaproteobacteria bacterium]|nr:extracellular solute-binding protein [Alphaproteobacteria bacterium]